jgi:hypothetical protein
MLLLRFDNRQPLGSRQHFFHFAWGYLFPALAEIYRIESSSSTSTADKKYLFQSCGPVMNEILKEMLALYDYRFQIMEENDIPEAYANSIFVPRWDIRINEMAARQQAGSDPLRRLSDLSFRFVKRLYGSEKASETHYLMSIIRVRDNTLARLGSYETGDKFKSLEAKYLILKRSVQPSFYEKGGQSEIPGYGTARRELRGIEEAVTYLNDRGIPTAIFEPGNHSYKEQIIVFQRCRGVIGIKGAEFANLLWMNKNGKVIQIRPSVMKTNNLQRTLAGLLELDFSELVDTSEGMFPALKGESLIELLNVALD